MNRDPASRRNFLQGAVAVGLVGTPWVRPVRAQPALGQLHVLCTGPAGSVPDQVARRIAEQLAPHHARSAVVENRPGAAGQIAVHALKSAAAESTTLLLAQGAIVTVYPYLYAKLAYDPVVDVRPVSLAGEMSLGLAVGPAVPASVTNTGELLAWMRDHPKQANVGSPGAGTLPHLLEVMLFRAAGVDWQHVVYAGGPPALVDLMGGQIAALVLPEGLLRQPAAAGKLRVLATSGAQRSSFLPAVPSLAEAGFPGLAVREWFAFFMSGRAAPEVVENVSRALRSAIAHPALAESFSAAGMVAASSTPAALAERIAREQGYWEPVIRLSNIRMV
jgi:tripartite-type tricarboxylate transporter receptor subunit TctC